MFLLLGCGGTVDEQRSVSGALAVECTPETDCGVAGWACLRSSGRCSAQCTKGDSLGNEPLPAAEQCAEWGGRCVDVPDDDPDQGQTRCVP